MEVIHDWVREQVDSIDADPSFLITSVGQEGPVYPWDGLSVNDAADSATITFQGGTDANGAYLIYAHLHLMAGQNRLDRWLPEAVGTDGFELERAILSKVADTWLYQRSLFDARPYGLLDELIYANENGFLDAFILTARPDAFVEARRDWLADSPQGSEAYADWFRQTFQREPPGMRGARPGA